MPWETVRRGTPNTSGAKASIVSLRRSAIAFSAFFIRSQSLERMTRVTIKADRETRRLGFDFHTNTDDPDCLILTADGGKRGTKNTTARAVQTTAIMRQPWIKAILTNRVEKRFVPYKEMNLWVIDLGPGFEVEVENALEVPADVTGVYRYLDGDEVTYIGRGRVRERIQDASREAWSFDRIQYSPLNDVAEEQRWEQLLLDEFAMTHGRLPRENRVRGFISRSPADE